MRAQLNHLHTNRSQVKAKGPDLLIEKAEQFAQGKVTKPLSKVFSLAITAGVFIGLAFMFYTTVTTGNTDAGWGANRLMGGLVFSMGLILVVVCGGELFTSSVLSVITRANRQINTRQMLKYWGTVYLGNFTGASLLVLLVGAAGVYHLDHGQWGLTALQVAQHKLHHGWLEAFSLGVLCNLMVCLAVWSTFSTDDILTKAALMVLPVAMFVATGFEHCVANMFMVPLGISIAQFAPAEFWSMLGVSAGQFSDLTYSHFITANLVPVTLGNIVGGGLLVGMSYWSIYRGKVSQPSAVLSPLELDAEPSLQPATLKVSDMLVKHHMQTQPLTLTADLPTTAAMAQLIMANKSGAPVVDENLQVIGYFSEHDAIVSAWVQDFQPKFDKTVGELMTTEVETVEADMNLYELAEHMCVDKKALYQVSDTGIATGFSHGTLLQRVKAQNISRHATLPVVENGKLLGIVSTRDIFNALRKDVGFTDNVVYAEFAKHQAKVKSA